MMTDVPAHTWFRSANLPRLAFAVVLSAPLAGALLSLAIAFTLMQGVIFLAPHPVIDSEFVKADPLQILANTVVVGGGGLMMGGLLGWPLMMAFGLPMHMILLRTTSAKAWHYVTAGLAGGFAAGLLRFAMDGGAASMNDLVILLAIGGLAGALSALVFWLVRRPDRDAAEYRT